MAERKTLEGYWEIVHEIIQTDHLGYGKTIVKSDNAENALRIYNDEIADGKWAFKTTLDCVYPLRYYG